MRCVEMKIWVSSSTPLTALKLAALSYIWARYVYNPTWNAGPVPRRRTSGRPFCFLVFSVMRIGTRCYKVGQSYPTPTLMPFTVAHSWHIILTCYYTPIFGVARKVPG